MKTFVRDGKKNSVRLQSIKRSRVGRFALAAAATAGAAGLLALGGCCGAHYSAPDPLQGTGHGPHVSVHLIDPVVTEGSGASAAFEIKRDGGLRDNLNVSYRIGGSAAAEQFAQKLSGQVTIPAGQRSVTLFATPIDDHQANPSRTLTLALTTPSDCNYRLAKINQATALVSDADGGQAKYRDLMVGPGQEFAHMADAVAASKDGDFIDILTSGDYHNNIAFIHRSNITIRGVGDGRVKLISDSRRELTNQMGIIVQGQNCRDLVLENLDMEGARNRPRYSNGCGIRTFGKNLTVNNCRFYNDEDGILGGSGNMLIEFSEFAHGSIDSQSHNLYINERVDTLTFQYNYTHDAGTIGHANSDTGHLFKSRAKINRILYNTFDSGRSYASYELSTPNGGQDTIIGNVIVQGSNSANPVIIDYASESRPSAGDFLFIANNTVVNWMTPRQAVISADDIEGETPQVVFVRAMHLPKDFDVTLVNNIFAGWGDIYSLAEAAADYKQNTTQPSTRRTIKGITKGKPQRAPKARMQATTRPAAPVTMLPPRLDEGNFIAPTIKQARFADPLSGNYHLLPDSGAIGIGIQLKDNAVATLYPPTTQPVSPQAGQPRPANSDLDAGAFGFPQEEVAPTPKPTAASK